MERYETHGNWKIDKFSNMERRHGKKYYDAECLLCNETYKVGYSDAVKGKTVMCRPCRGRNTFSKHGESPSTGKPASVLYSRWLNMKDRCYNKRNSHYKSYGALGVTVCDEWKNDYLAFKEWALNSGFRKELQIDKDILSDKLNLETAIYSPETCHWITPNENFSYSIDKRDKTALKLQGLKQSISKRSFTDEQLDKAVRMLKADFTLQEAMLISGINNYGIMSKIKRNEIKSISKLNLEYQDIVRSV